MLDLEMVINDEENGTRFEDQELSWKGTGILFRQDHQFINMLRHWRWYKLFVMVTLLR